ncbi:GNAT family N-acetyltransferase [Massilia sp. IC2-477]|uniref:GNAT family N-acetyltransferase n=1 Tax=Massilia sp. IC2-477 TaxID=2887198 RepID=UPI001D111E97|nr:GNAT family N-acetyltransferase [Massilia sp. IC2-477]MCC2957465.1 GNAT family N-acetyltransferase [Massilia sp. IC2-477]
MQHAYQASIRAMRAADLDAVLAVQAACYPPAMQEAAAVVLARVSAAGDTCIVAEDDRGVCAYLFAYPSTLGMVTPLGAEFAPAADADTLYLHDLAVAPRAHGRGLARRLVEHLLARAQGLSASALVSVQDTAGFWTTLGYRPANSACADALASYPGEARYMVRPLTGPGVPSPSCSSLRP